MEKDGIVPEKKNHGWTGEIVLSVSESDEPEGGWPFKTVVVGRFVWLADRIRPVISYEVTAVARYCHAPKYVHCHAALSILRRNLKCTRDVGRTFSEVVA